VGLKGPPKLSYPHPNTRQAHIYKGGNKSGDKQKAKKRKRSDKKGEGKSIRLKCAKIDKHEQQRPDVGGRGAGTCWSLPLWLSRMAMTGRLPM